MKENKLNKGLRLFGGIRLGAHSVDSGDEFAFAVEEPRPENREDCRWFCGMNDMMLPNPCALL